MKHGRTKKVILPAPHEDSFDDNPRDHHFL